MRKALSVVLSAAGISICICAWPLFDTYTRYQHQTEQFRQEEAKLDAEEAASIAKLCVEYKKWQYYMLINGHSKAEYTTTMDQRCYDKSSD